MRHFRKKFTNALLVCLALILCAGCRAGEAESVNLGKFSKRDIERIILRSREMDSPSERTAFISERFLGIPYRENTLQGSHDARERFVVNLAGMDCFTLLDYVETLRLSAESGGGFGEFEKNLKKVRYKNGAVSYGSRRHFFSDWLTGDSVSVKDVTALAGGELTRKTVKTLNRKADGKMFVEKIPQRTAEVSFIKPEDLSSGVFDRLQTGDYAGIYSEKQGLDVSHTGIIVKKDNVVYIRHASSNGRLGKVADEKMMDYIKGKPGLVVFRPINTVGRKEGKNGS